MVTLITQACLRSKGLPMYLNVKRNHTYINLSMNQRDGFLYDNVKKFIKQV